MKIEEQEKVQHSPPPSKNECNKHWMRAKKSQGKYEGKTIRARAKGKGKGKGKEQGQRANHKQIFSWTKNTGGVLRGSLLLYRRLYVLARPWWLWIDKAEQLWQFGEQTFFPNCDLSNCLVSRASNGSRGSLFEKPPLYLFCHEWWIHAQACSMNLMFKYTNTSCELHDLLCTSCDVSSRYL